MKKVIIVTASLIASITTMKSMQPLGAKLGQWTVKSIAKKSFSAFMTGMHWTIAAGLPITGGTIKLLAQTDPKIELQIMEIGVGKLTDPSKATKQFIQEELAKRNTPLEDVKVSPGRDSNVAVGKYNCIVTKQTHDDLHKAIEENNESIKKEVIGILNHEPNHIKHKDIFTRSLAYLLSPFISHISIKKINKFFVPQSIKINNFWVKQLIKIPSGIGKLVVSIGGVAVLSRYQEQRADDDMENNIDILEGFKSNLKKDFHIEISSIENRSPFSRAWQRYTASHPSAESRIAKLDQRIEKLKQEQKTT
jgi:hypothetical protein